MISLFSSPKLITDTDLLALLATEQANTSSFTRYLPDRTHRLGFHQGQFYMVSTITDVLHSRLSQIYTYTSRPSHDPKFPHAIVYGIPPDDVWDVVADDDTNDTGIEKDYYV